MQPQITAVGAQQMEETSAMQLPEQTRSSFLSKGLSLGKVLIASVGLAAAVGCDYRLAPATAERDPVPVALKTPAIGGTLLDPWLFQENRGQWPAELSYVARRDGNELLIHKRGFTVVTRNGRPSGLELLGVNDRSVFAPGKSHPAVVSYRATSHDGQRLEAGMHQQVRQQDVYQGIDLVYYSRAGAPQFDFVVRPGASPDAIALKPALDESARVLDDGSLELSSDSGALQFKPPVAYQVEGDRHIATPVAWTVGENQEIGFKVGRYDSRIPLVIDPVIVLAASRYIGVGGNEEIAAIARNNIGGIRFDYTWALINVTETGYTCNGFDPDPPPPPVGVPPVPLDPVQPGCIPVPNNNLRQRVALATFTNAGSLIRYTYFADDAVGTALNLSFGGDAYITGTAVGPNFSTTANAYQRTTQAAETAFFAVVTDLATQIFMVSYYGGAGGSHGESIAVIDRGRFTLAGTAGPGLPTTVGSFMPSIVSGEAGFVAKFNVWESSPARMLTAGTYFGAVSPEANQTRIGNTIEGVSMDRQQRPWVVGEAFTTRLPITSNAAMARPTALDPGCAAGSTLLNSFGYAARLSADLARLEYSSYLTGYSRPVASENCREALHSVTVDTASGVYVGGTTSTRNLSTTVTAAQPQPPGSDSVPRLSGYAIKLDGARGTVQWASYLGGDAGNTFVNAVDSEYGAGGFGTAPDLVFFAATSAGGTDFPVVSGEQRVAISGPTDAVLFALAGQSGTLRAISALGGSNSEAGLAVATDYQSQEVFIAGSTRSGDFPVAGPPQGRDPVSATNVDGFLSRYSRGITNFSPRQGGNGGEVTLTVDGPGADATAKCVLTRAGLRIVSTASRTTVTSSGTRLQCLMGLKGAQVGSWTLAVENSDGRQFLAPAPFEVVAAPAANTPPPVWASIVGSTGTLRAGRTHRLFVHYGNAGANNVSMVPIWLSWPASSGVTVTPYISPSPRLPGWPERLSAPPPTPILVNGRYVLPLIANQMRAYGDAYLPFDVNIPNGSSGPLDMEVEVSPPWPTTTDDNGNTVDFYPTSPPPAGAGGGITPEPPDINCIRFIIGLAAEAIPGAGCPQALAKAVIAVSADENLKQFDTDRVSSQQDLLLDVLQNSVECAASLVGGVPFALVKLTSIFTTAYERSQELFQCLSPLDRDRPAIELGGAFDPNFKAGPQGDGSPQHHLGKVIPVGYVIGFENQPTASLPAATVYVTDQIDTQRFDAESLTLGAISWGDQLIRIPSGLQTYTGIHRVNQAISVRISADFNRATGQLSWTLETIDPQTGLPPSDSSLGFLPPNRNGTEGQGYLNFSISPKSDLPDASVLSNSASIIFDTNAPILTNVWVNKLDFSKPVSRMLAATLDASGATATLSWDAGDSAGSGVQTVDIYRSEDGGSFSVWRSFADERSAVISVSPGKRYAFFAIATDRVGNVESLKSAGEVSLVVDATNSGPIPGGETTGGGGGGGGSTGWGFLLLLSLAVAILKRRQQPI